MSEQSVDAYYDIRHSFNNKIPLSALLDMREPSRRQFRTCPKSRQVRSTGLATEALP